MTCRFGAASGRRLAQRCIAGLGAGRVELTQWVENGGDRRPLQIWPRERTVATACYDHASGAAPLVALNSGYQAAFFVGALFALTACAIGALGRPQGLERH